MVKTSIILFVALALIAVVTSASGFYVLGYYEGHSAGFQSGYHEGILSSLVQEGSRITLSPGSTMLVSTGLMNGNNVTIDYSFSVPVPFSKNITVKMDIQTVGARAATVFSTGYVTNASGQVFLEVPDYETIEIEFKANSTNNAPTTLDFTSSLLMKVKG